MRRLLHILLLALSLTIALLATAFHRPIHAFDPLRRYTYTEFTLGTFTITLGLNDFGGFSFTTQHHLDPPIPWPATIKPRPGVSMHNEVIRTLNNACGFTYARIDTAPAPFTPLTTIARITVLPYWFLLTLFLAYPILYPLTRRLRAWRTNLKNHQGLCPTCAYDLRAHTPGTNCPECGTPAPAPRNSAEPLASCQAPNAAAAH